MFGFTPQCQQTHAKQIQAMKKKGMLNFFYWCLLQEYYFYS